MGTNAVTIFVTVNLNAFKTTLSLSILSLTIIKTELIPLYDLLDIFMVSRQTWSL